MIAHGKFKVRELCHVTFKVKGIMSCDFKVKGIMSCDLIQIHSSVWAPLPCVQAALWVGREDGCLVHSFLPAVNQHLSTRWLLLMAVVAEDRGGHCRVGVVWVWSVGGALINAILYTQWACYYIGLTLCHVTWPTGRVIHLNAFVYARDWEKWFTTWRKL